ncbi:monovalent cation/H(+) antiporter subunit G [Bounagaea algeriensis]
MSVLDVFSAVCLLMGAVSCLLGAIGMLRFPDVAARLQAATKPQTLGLLLILVGTAVRLEGVYTSGLILVALFQMLISPITSQLVGRAGYRADSLDRNTLRVDELDERLRREERVR